MNLYLNNKIKSEQLFFPENMVHVVFLLKTRGSLQNLFHNFWITGTRDMIFAKTAQP